jgi:hypothetical protein
VKTAALRRLTIFGTPVGLGILAAIHPMTPAGNIGVWNLIHLLQIPLAALLGVAVLLMLDGVEGVAATAVRLAVVPWAATFAAYDATAGLATGILADFAHAHGDVSTAVGAASWTIVVSPMVNGLQLAAVLCGLVVFGGAGMALRRTGVSTAATLAIAAGGIVWTFVHPIIGAPAMLAFLVGAIVSETVRAMQRRTRLVSSNAIASAPIHREAQAR